MSSLLAQAFRLDDRVVIVTGASSGLGVDFAEAVAAAGADVAICARRADRLAETAERIRARGRGCLTSAADVSQVEDCQRVVQETMDEFGRVDVLINNAGIGTATPALREEPQDFQRVLDVNVSGSFWMAQACARVMQPGSSIINVGSILGSTTAELPQAAYCTSKAAIIGLTRDLAQEWTGRKGIRVNALAPGFFPTEMTDAYPDGYLDRVLQRVPMGRTGRGEELAAAAVFLASDAASYISGVLLPVDGGLLTELRDAMKQLTGLDATFLHLETATQFGHVAGLGIFSRPTDRGYEPLTAWKEQVRSRLPLLPPLRRRLVELPLGLDHPYWLEDPGFDLDFHVRHAAVPPPGNDQQLAMVVARIVGRPLDRARPLWLSYVIEGLAGDRFATLTIFHHAAIDGALGSELLGLMLDPEPDSEPALLDDDWRPRAKPSDLELLARGAMGLARKPARAVMLAARTTEELGRATRNPALAAAARQVRAGLRGRLGTVLNLGRDRGPERDTVTPLPSVRPPRTPFNKRITPHRSLAIGTASLEDIKAIKNAYGVTVNDVVIAVCTAGLRTWLQRHDALPADPLVALVPVSVRTGNEADPWQNRVAMLTATLPTDEPDASERLRTVHEGMQQSKELFAALPAERLTDFTEFPPPAVFARAMRLSARLGLGSRIAPGNLVISNVPGPRTPLYAAGARLEHYYPISVLVEGQGLNITVQSYLDRLDFGLICCPELVPDVDDLLEAILEEVRVLAAG